MSGRVLAWSLSLCLPFSAGLCTLQSATLRTSGGEVLTGEVTPSSMNTLNVSATGSLAKRIPLSELIRVDFDETGKKKMKSFETGVFTVDGSFLAGQIVNFEPEAVRMQGRSNSVALKDVARIILDPGQQTALAALKPGQSGVLLKNGDFLEGEVRVAEKSRLLVSSLVLGLRPFDRGQLSAVVLRPMVTGGAAFFLELWDGTLLSARALETASDAFLATAGEMPTKLPLSEVKAISAGPLRMLRLGGMQSQVASNAGIEEALSIDALPARVPALVGGVAQTPSLALKAGASATYVVPDHYSIFSTTIAVPDNTPTGVSLSFSILVDRRPIFKSLLMKAGDAPKPLRFNLGSARSLLLYVEAASPAAVGAPGLWIDPILARP